MSNAENEFPAGNIISTIEPNKNLEKIQKKGKFFALAAVSFAIPVLFYFQANELKEKELKNMELARVKDSLHMRYENFRDSNIQNAKIKAYESYISKMNELTKPDVPITPPNAANYDLVIRLLEKMTDQMNLLYENTKTIKELQKNQATDADINKVITRQQNLEYAVSDLRNQVNSIYGLFFKQTPGSSEPTAKVSSSGLTITGVKDSESKTFLIGQLEQFRKRISDLRILYGDSINGDSAKTTIRKTRRQKNIENLFLIDKSQKIIDSLISDMNRIYQSQ